TIRTRDIEYAAREFAAVNGGRRIGEARLQVARDLGHFAEIGDTRRVAGEGARDGGSRSNGGGSVATNALLELGKAFFRFFASSEGLGELRGQAALLALRNFVREARLKRGVAGEFLIQLLPHGFHGAGRFLALREL